MVTQPGAAQVQDYEVLRDATIALLGDPALQKMTETLASDSDELERAKADPAGYLRASGIAIPPDVEVELTFPPEYSTYGTEAAFVLCFFGIFCLNTRRRE